MMKANVGDLDDEAKEKLWESDQKKREVLPENLDDEAQKKLHKGDQKTIHENLNGEAKGKVCKAANFETCINKPNSICINVIRKKKNS